MTKAWMHTISGRSITMARPAAAEVDPLMDLPETLARITRYNGTVPGGIYSVAQHCALMSDAVLDETGDANFAALALVHDAHEYIWGDITTPQAQGLAEIEADLFGDSRVRAVIDEAKRRGDEAIFRACGIPFPPTPDQLRLVKLFDIRMLATERQQLLATSPRRWSAAVESARPIRMRGGMTLWSIARAADEYRRRLVELCPAVARRSSQR